MIAGNENKQDGVSSAAQLLKRPRNIGCVAIALATLWLATGFYTVASNQRGVVTRFGKLHARVGPGIHYTFPAPIDRVYKPATTEVRRIEVGFKSRGVLWRETRRSDMITGDQNILKVMMVVQYTVREPEAYLFETQEPTWLVERAVETALSTFIAQLPVDDVLTTAKSEIEIRVIEKAQTYLDAYGTGVSLLNGNLQIVSPPVPVIEAFNDVARAKKDSERVVEDARVYENQIVPQAEGEAHAIVNKALGAYEMRTKKAHGEAKRFKAVLGEYERDRETTRRRLYLETVERIFKKTNVVIVDDSSKVTIIE